METAYSKNSELLGDLEELFNTSGTEILEKFSDAMKEEVRLALVTAILRVAEEYPQLLSAEQMNALERLVVDLNFPHTRD